MAHGRNGDVYVALFVSIRELGLDRRTVALDLWDHDAISISETVESEMEPHGARLFRLPDPSRVPQRG